MKAFSRIGFFLVALALSALPLRADPPLLMVGSAGPGVEIGGFAQTTLVSASERGLSVGFDDLSDLIPPVDGGTEFIPNPTIIAFDVFRDAEAYRVTRTAETVEVQADGGARVQIRIGGSGAVPASATGPTLEAARAAALADAALDGIRARIVGSDVVSATPTVTTSEVNSSALTGRDAFVTTVIVFGPDESFRTRGGNVGLCTSFVTGCDGGTRVTIDDDITLFNTFTLQDLYITDTLTRTATTVEEWFLDIFLEGGDGAPHAGAQAVGFEAGEGFLARLEDEAGVPAGSRVTTSTMGGPPAGRLRFSAGASGGAGSFDRIGTVEDSDWNAAGLTGGFAYAVSAEWTVGTGVEAGRWSWNGEGVEAEGDTRKVGLFAAWSRGPWQVTLAGFAGRHDVETEDALGVTADYKADVRGASVTVGHDFAAGAWTLTPQVALRWVEWDAPRITDSVGGIVAAVDAVQFRPELGLTARRRIEMKRGTMDLGLDARVWTVEGDRVAVASGGFVTDGPETGKVGGSLGLTAGWRVAPATVLTARIETRFSEEGSSTTAGLGLRLRF